MPDSTHDYRILSLYNTNKNTRHNRLYMTLHFIYLRIYSFAVDLSLSLSHTVRVCVRMRAHGRLKSGPSRKRDSKFTFGYIKLSEIADYARACVCVRLCMCVFIFLRGCK